MKCVMRTGTGRRNESLQSMIGVAAELIRRAAADDSYSQELYDAVAADQAAFWFLVHAPVQHDELRWLAPSEWLCFAQWRQDRGGPLDQLILDRLDQALSAASRVFRFEARGMVMEDPESNDAAETLSARQDQIGLQWAQRHAQDFQDSLEIARDALQYATPVAWHTLRILTALDDSRAAAIQEMLDQFAADRDIDPEITRLWRHNSQP
jgi:hypothetical protein